MNHVAMGKGTHLIISATLFGEEVYQAMQYFEALCVWLLVVAAVLTRIHEDA